MEYAVRQKEFVVWVNVDNHVSTIFLVFFMSKPLLFDCYSAEALTLLQVFFILLFFVALSVFLWCDSFCVFLIFFLCLDISTTMFAFHIPKTKWWEDKCLLKNCYSIVFITLEKTDLPFIVEKEKPAFHWCSGCVTLILFVFGSCAFVVFCLYERAFVYSHCILMYFAFLYTYGILTNSLI